MFARNPSNRRWWIALAALLAGALQSRTAVAIDALQVRGTYLTGLRVETCAPSGACSELVRYPTQPPRTIHAVALSPSGRYFFVWSSPDRHARELEVFEVTSAGATRLAQWSPGFGGDLRWVEGDRLLHSWGCGTACVNGVVYDVRGRQVFSEPAAAWFSTSPDGRVAAFAFHGGAVVLLRLATMQTRRIAPTPNALFPIDLSWGRSAARVVFDSTRGPRIRVSAPLP